MATDNRSTEHLGAQGIGGGGEGGKRKGRHHRSVETLSLARENVTTFPRGHPLMMHDISKTSAPNAACILVQCPLSCYISPRFHPVIHHHYVQRSRLVIRPRQSTDMSISRPWYNFPSTTYSRITSFQRIHDGRERKQMMVNDSIHD